MHPNTSRESDDLIQDNVWAPLANLNEIVQTLKIETSVSLNLAREFNEPFGYIKKNTESLSKPLDLKTDGRFVKRLDCLPGLPHLIRNIKRP